MGEMMAMCSFGPDRTAVDSAFDLSQCICQHQYQGSKYQLIFICKRIHIKTLVFAALAH